VPIEGREALEEIFEGSCAYCPALATTYDHIEPVSRGGRTEPWNIVPACNPCNSSKRARDLDEWLAATGRSLDIRVVDRMSLIYVP
jgi:5-methylcytosine-specific restriction endonuclease McrA